MKILNRFTGKVIMEVANLSGVDLSRAHLAVADLSRVDLSGANLSGANLSGADLAVANLSGADLSGANLSRVNLYLANLYRANLSGANLSDTVLDPCRNPNGDIDGFERCGRYVIGYRTRRAGHIDQYRDGRTYTADWFSTCPVTDCHPGYYIWPTLSQSVEFAKANYGGGQQIRVYVKPEDVHRTPKKWRCRMFEVIGTAQ